jgi:hypothetical protein
MSSDSTRYVLEWVVCVLSYEVELWQDLKAVFFFHPIFVGGAGPRATEGHK